MLSTMLVLSLSAQPAEKPNLLPRVQSASKRAAGALIERQNKDGGYGPGKSDVGITALVVWALASCPAKYRDRDGPFMSAAIDFLLKHQRPDGGIHDGELWNYKTSISLTALAAVDPVKYKAPIDAAAAFVKKLQASEESEPLPYDPKRHPGYGGWGYGSEKRPDMSNTNLALEALAAARVSADDPIWVRSIRFLSNTQNSCSTNQAWKDGLTPGRGNNDDGGFPYTPEKTYAPVVKMQDGTTLYSSYASMTYAGIKSFIYAHMKRDDERVQKAYRWICTHYSVDENVGLATKEKPELGKQGLYYYYRTMAKTFLLWGEPEVPTPQGRRRWAEDLGEKLLSLQSKDGTWINEAEERWWEGIAEVCTPFAILALADVEEALKRWPPAPAAPAQR